MTPPPAHELKANSILTGLIGPGQVVG